MPCGSQGVQLESTPGLDVYVDEPGAPDYDAMVMLNMTVLGRTEHPDHNPSTDSQITH